MTNTYKYNYFEFLSNVPSFYLTSVYIVSLHLPAQSLNGIVHCVALHKVHIISSPFHSNTGLYTGEAVLVKLCRPVRGVESSYVRFPYHHPGRGLRVSSLCHPRRLALYSTWRGLGLHYPFWTTHVGHHICPGYR